MCVLMISDFIEIPPLPGIGDRHPEFLVPETMNTSQILDPLWDRQCVQIATSESNFPRPIPTSESLCRAQSSA